VAQGAVTPCAIPTPTMQNLLTSPMQAMCGPVKCVVLCQLVLTLATLQLVLGQRSPSAAFNQPPDTNS
jgi:hypothetical protein